MFQTICIVVVILGLFYLAYFLWVVFIYRARKEEEAKQATVLEMTRDNADD